jgi:tetratricopeptide (TPR) repeat protein
MSYQTPKENNFISSETAVTATTASSNTTHPKQRIVQNFVLIWIDTEIDQSNKDCQSKLVQLRNVVNEVHIFTHRDECIDFLTELDYMKIFLIIEGNLSQQILPLIHEIPQLDAVYIFCNNKSGHEQWAKTWMKVKGIHTEIASICESLNQAVKQFNQDSIAVSFVSVSEDASNQNLNELEPSFMYTQLLKEILLEMEYDHQSIKDFTAYCRKNDYGSTTNITRFENDYNANLAIWWYTYPSFIYSLLNCALRMLEADTIINMAFFIRDLHHQIKQLHQKQLDSYQGKPFVVYRGQSVTAADFEKLLKTKGGLMSFNNFLSTSKQRELSLGFAKAALGKTDTVGIFFQIFIDPFLSSAPFAAIDDISYYKEEKEFLFSMHSVFRIGEITKIDNNNPLYQVELRLTADDDPQLRILTEHMRKQFTRGTGWNRLSTLLIKIGHFDKAEELLKLLLKQTFDEGDKVTYYSNLGYLKTNQGDYKQAICYYEKAIEILENTRPPNHPDLANPYSNIGSIYCDTGNYSKALLFQEKALEIRQKTLRPNHPDFVASYNSIGALYKSMGEYSKALLFHEQALEIQQKTLPPNHPDLAISYNNVGIGYSSTGEYTKALSFQKKAFEIQQKTLPANHPSLAKSYYNIGALYKTMGEYSKASSFHEKALEIQKKTLPPNHPDLATSYNNVGMVYSSMGEYSKALSFQKKAFEIQQKTLPANHPSLATSYNNIGQLYESMGEYSKALSSHEKALEIQQKTLPPNHPHLATSYNNIGLVYSSMREYSKALSSHEKALEIDQKTLPPNHPHLATSYNNIGVVYSSMGEYSKALSSHEKALEIEQKTLPANHPNFATSYNNIGQLYESMGEYSKALSSHEKALEIQQKTLPPNHPEVASSYNNIGLVYSSMREYSKALSSHEKALEIRHKILPPNHPYFATSYNNIGVVYCSMREYSKALLVFERGLKILQRTQPANHPHIKSAQENIEFVKTMQDLSVY